MSKEKPINHGTLHDTINYEALIEAQSKNITYLETLKCMKNEISKHGKQKTYTKCYIRGKLNK